MTVNRPKLLHQRRVRKGVSTGYRVNCINAHEEIISSTLKSASKSATKVNDRFLKFRRKCSEEAQSQENIEWLRLCNDLNEDSALISKSLDNAVEVIICQDDFKELSCFLQDTTSSYKAELVQRLNKSRISLGDGQPFNLNGASIVERGEEESFSNIRAVHYEEMELLQNQAESLEAQIRKHEEDISQSSPWEVTIPQELIVNLENLNDLLLCFKTYNYVNDDFQEGVACAIRGIAEDWKTKFSYPETKEGMEKDTHQRERRALFLKDLEQIQDLRKYVVEQACDDLTDLISDAVTHEQEFRLNYLRQLKELSRSIANDRISKQQLKEYEEEQLCKEKKDRERSATKHALEEYHDLKSSEQIQKTREDEERSRVEKEERKQRSATNCERVYFRRNKLAEKQKKRQCALEKSRKDEIDKLEKLQRLAATVPYHSAIIAKTSDLTKSTAARMNDIYDYPDDSSDLKDFQQGLKKMKGFTTERVFSDPKFRLAHALHQSGKASSAYSLAVVKKLIPRNAERTTGIGPEKKY